MHQKSLNIGTESCTIARKTKLPEKKLFLKGDILRKTSKTLNQKSFWETVGDSVVSGASDGTCRNLEPPHTS